MPPIFGVWYRSEEITPGRTKVARKCVAWIKVTLTAALNYYREWVNV